MLFWDPGTSAWGLPGSGGLPLLPLPGITPFLHLKRAMQMRAISMGRPRVLDHEGQNNAVLGVPAGTWKFLPGQGTFSQEVGEEAVGEVPQLPPPILINHSEGLE